MGSVGAKSGLSDLISRASAETNPNRVLNSVEWAKLGSNFQALSPVEKSTITGLLRLTKSDVEHLTSNTQNPTISDAVRIDGKKYTVTIGTNADKTNVVYTLKQGNKNIVKEGTYENVANQLAVIVERSKRK